MNPETVILAVVLFILWVRMERINSAKRFSQEDLETVVSSIRTEFEAHIVPQQIPVLAVDMFIDAVMQSFIDGQEITVNDGVEAKIIRMAASGFERRPKEYSTFYQDPETGMYVKQITFSYIR